MEKKILIVDDEDAIRNLFHAALAQQGFTVETAASAEEALERIRHSHFHVFFLDLNLPGMNGIELCRAILQQQPDAVTYAITGYTSRFKADECMKIGFKDYFTKPISLHILFKAAQEAFNEKQIT